MPTIGTSQIKLLERLCNASAVSGDEGEVRAIIIEELKHLPVEYQVDALGNVLVRRSAAKNKPPRVMVCAHMDEVGFMLVADDGDGLFRFEIVGGLDLSQLPGKAVLVGREHLPGVIGARPIHLTTPEERKHKIPLDAMRIDLGPGEVKVKPGTRAVFSTRFQRNGQVLLAKALDDRLGIVTLLELVKSPPENIDLQAAFTVQEEIGLRGARVAAHTMQPDLAVVLDATPARETPHWDGDENASYNTKLGLGPAIYIADGSSLNDPRLVRLFIETGEAEGIPHQIRQPGSGGTDAGAIHLSRSGVPSITVSVPHRHSHTAVSIARLEDWKNTLRLVYAAMSRITPSLLAKERK